MQFFLPAPVVQSPKLRFVRDDILSSIELQRFVSFRKELKRVPECVKFIRLLPRGYVR